MSDPVNHVWSHLLDLIHAAEVCTFRPKSMMVTERSDELAAAALRYAAAHLEATQPDNATAVTLRQWAGDFAKAVSK